MDVNLLTLSVGNSRLAIGVFQAGELKHTARVSLDDPDAFTREIAKAWRMLPETGGPAIAGASVNPGMDDAIESAALRVTNHTIEWIGEEIALPIKVKTEAPEQTGVDRVLNVAAAYEQLGVGCLVVDAGTAITIDVCDDSGAFLGGAILPGATMMLKSLNEMTAKLPLVTLATPETPFGSNTEDAIRHGVYHGIRGMVKEIVEQFATQLGRWPDLIATGGDAKSLFGGWELVHAISPDLTLYGIALAYTNHYVEQG